MLIIEIQNAFVVRSQAREFSHMFRLRSIDRPTGPLNHRRKETFKCGTTMKIGWHKSHDQHTSAWKFHLKKRRKKTRCWNIFRLFQVFNWKHMWRWLHLTNHYASKQRKKKKILQNIIQNFIFGQVSRHWLLRNFIEFQISPDLLRNSFAAAKSCASGGEAFSSSTAQRHSSHGKRQEN